MRGYSYPIVTFGNEMNPQPSRRDVRPSATPSMKPETSSKRTRRTLVSTVATLAAVGFVAAYGVAAVAAPMQSTESAQAVATSYSESLADAQSLQVGEAAAGTDFSRGSYTGYKTPTPTPTPTKTPEAASVDEDAGDSSGESTESAPAPTYTGGGSPQEWMTAAGIAQSDWGYVDYIATHESGWNPSATNASSGACGLIQALPCSKVPGDGYNPVDNLRWAAGYAIDRYGSWAGAYQFWISNNWW